MMLLHWRLSVTLHTRQFKHGFSVHATWLMQTETLNGFFPVLKAYVRLFRQPQHGRAVNNWRLIIICRKDRLLYCVCALNTKCVILIFVSAANWTVWSTYPTIFDGANYEVAQSPTNQRILFVTVCSMDEYAEEKRTEQNLIVRGTWFTILYLKPKQLIMKDCARRFVLKLYRHEASRGLFATAARWHSFIHHLLRQMAATYKYTVKYSCTINYIYIQ